jgi:sulfite oxidase
MWNKRAEMIVHEHDPYNAETPHEALCTSLTPTDAFYVRSHGAVPEIEADGWRLTVDGMVAQPGTFSLADLQQRFDQHTVLATMQCAGNRRAGLIEVRDIPGEAPWGPGATSTAEWTGVRLADVLATAELAPKARFVAFAAPDVAPEAKPPQPFGASIDVAKATSNEVLLAWEMNGQSLAPVHGAPVRVVVPGYIGARSVKWVERITAQSEPADNYFQAVAYRLLPADADPADEAGANGLPLASVALNCEILAPRDDEVVAAGPAQVRGYAYAGDNRSVVRVDVSADGGESWVQADVEPPASSWVWQHWTARVQLAPGASLLVARAWDSTGASQPESPRHLWNPKGYVNNAWSRVRITAQ